MRHEADLKVPARRRFLGRLGRLSAAAVSAALAPATARATGPSPVTALFFDPAFLDFRHAPGHPESPARAAALQGLWSGPPLAGALAALTAAAADEDTLQRVHPASHVARIARERPDAHAVAATAVGGMLACVDAVFQGRVRNAFCASRPPGHHAFADGREEGFCYYNAVAIAARHAQRHWGVRRVLIVDWDYHHGNGTETAFYEDPDVLVFSTHDWNAYPGTGAPSRQGRGAGLGYNINVHLDCGSGDAAVIEAFDRHLLPRVEAFAPELLLISAGFDSRQDDLLGCFAFSDTGFSLLTQRLMDVADRHCGGRLVSVLEGGYNIAGTASAARAHLQALMQA